MMPVILTRKASGSAAATQPKVTEVSVDVRQKKVVRQASPPARRYPILLIDPRPFTRQLLVYLIETTTHEYDIRAIAGVDQLPDEDPERCNEVVFVILNIGSGRVSEDAVKEQILCINEVLPDVPVILLSQWEHVGDFAEALRQGVRGYLTTSLDPRVAVEVLRLVHAGGTFIPANGLPDALPDRQPSATDDITSAGPSGRFTRRQWQVLRLLQEGKPNKIIAHQLNLTESTVKIHVRQIMKKLSATNRTQAALLSRNLFGCEGKA